MKLLCKLIGHDYTKGGEMIEKPYEGNHSVNGHKPHTLYRVMVFCKRCKDTQHLDSYFFGYDQDIK